MWLFTANVTFESEVSADEESDKDLNEVDAAMLLPSPTCFLSPSDRPSPLLEGVRVLLRACVWLWGEGFLSFFKGSSITVGPPGSFKVPLEEEVQLDGRGCGWVLTPFLEMGKPKPPSTDWILRSCAGSSFCEEKVNFYQNKYLIFKMVEVRSSVDPNGLVLYLCDLWGWQRSIQVGPLYLFRRHTVLPRIQHGLLGGLPICILFGFRDPLT